MASKFQYRMTQKAQADVDNIVAYLAVELANPKAASDFINRLQKVVEEACLFPESGALVENDFLQNKAVRKKLIGNYVLFYLPLASAEQILVLRVIYGRRNMEEIRAYFGF